MRRVLITGSNRGLGLEMVRQYLQDDNTQVFATCRSPHEATTLNELVTAHPGRATVLALDAADTTSIVTSAETVAEQVSGLDILINNGAINPPGQSLGAIDTEKLLSILHVNVVGPLMVVKSYLDLLKVGTNARVANISSGMGSVQSRRSGGSYGYTASKAALNIITRGLAADLKPYGILTVAINPGWVKTDMGGAGATLTPEESIRGVLNVIDSLAERDSGTFLKWNGEPNPW